MTLNPVVLAITTLAVVGSLFNAPATRQAQADKRPFLIATTDTSPHPGPLVATSYNCAQVLKGSVVVIYYCCYGNAGPIYVPIGYSLQTCPPSQASGITGYVP